MTYSCIYLCGGMGKRAQFNIPKQFIKIGKKPILIYPLELIINIDKIDEIVITSPLEYFDLTIQILIEYNIVKYNNSKKNFKHDLQNEKPITNHITNTKKNNENYIEKQIVSKNKNNTNYCFNKTFKTINNKKLILVQAGSTRQQSVLNALFYCSNKYIILHESSRPVITKSDFKALLDNKAENITYGIKVPFTVLKKSNNFITEILNREKLINIQLPQKFNKDELLQAHLKAKEENRNFTDDSSLLFYYGAKVKVLEGKPENIKITYKIDIDLIKILIKQKINRTIN